MARRRRSNRMGCTVADGSEKAIYWSNYWKAKWADPDYRAERQANPIKYSRTGVPHGLRRDEAELLRAEATMWVDEWMKELEAAGIVLTDGQIIPGSDDAIAKAAIREAAIIALSPGSKKDKLTALNMCLNFTKSKPVAKTEVAMKKPEDWLAEVVVASKQAKELALPDVDE